PSLPPSLPPPVPGPPGPLPWLSSLSPGGDLPPLAPHRLRGGRVQVLLPAGRVVFKAVDEEGDGLRRCISITIIVIVIVSYYYHHYNKISMSLFSFLLLAPYSSAGFLGTSSPLNFP
ncbi:hypothetical protein Naga_103792g1, partial [Nannochloropsis gaditana]